MVDSDCFFSGGYGCVLECAREMWGRSGVCERCWGTSGGCASGVCVRDVGHARGCAKEVKNPLLQSATEM